MQIWNKFGKIIVLSAVSVALSILLNIRWGITFADTFFISAFVFVVSALMGIVVNLGSFKGVGHGTKQLVRVIRKKKPEQEPTAERAKRPTKDILLHLSLGILFFIISVILSNLPD